MAPADTPSPQGGGGHPQNASPDGVASPGSSSSAAPATSVVDNLTQALRELARGEQTATALEANLSALESKLDDILASFDTLAEEGNGAGDEVKDGGHATANGDNKPKDGAQS